MYILFTVSGSLLRDLWTFLQQTCELGFSLPADLHFIIQFELCQVVLGSCLGGELGNVLLR